MASDLAKRMAGIEGSGVRRMFELVATMENPVNLSIGQADYDAPEAMKDAAIEAIRNGQNRYTVTEGRPDLCRAVLDHLAGRYGHRPASVLMTSGVSGGLLLSVFALLDPGDEVLLPDPYFVMYKNMLRLVGAEPRYYDLYPGKPGDGWRPDLDQLAGLFTKRTRAILLNSPSNPTGGLLSSDDCDALVDLAARHGAWLVSDEVYDHFVYDQPFDSMVTRMARYERTIVLGGMSKTYGVPGWRLGWAAGPDGALDAMKLLQQYTFVCCPAPLQQGALAAFGLDLEDTRAAYRKKRDFVYDGLKDLYALERTEGSFYAFPAYPEGWTESAFVEACLAQKLLIVPGSAFSRRATHFRLSFAAKDEQLAKGVDMLRELAARGPQRDGSRTSAVKTRALV